MTREELWTPVRNGFDKAIDQKRLDALLKRNFGSIEEYLESKHIGSGQLDTDAVTSDALAPGAVRDEAVSDVSVDKVTSGIWKAFATMQGAIEAGFLKISEDGMTILDSNGAVVFRGGGDGSAPFVRGQFEAENLLVDGTGDRGFELRGPGHVMAAGSTMVMGGATTGTGKAGDPPAAPGLEAFWDKESLGTPNRRLGLHWDATNTSWWTTKGDTVYENDNDAPHTQLRTFTVSGVNKLYGAVRVGTRIYVLMKHESGETLIRTFLESNLSYIQQRNVTFGVGEVFGEPCIGYDGTNIVICDLDGAGTGREIRFHKYTLADEPAFVSTTTASGAGRPTFDSQRDRLTGFALAETLWWIVGNGVVYAFSTAGVYSADKDFYSDSSVVGLTHDGTRFWTLGTVESNAMLVKHTNWDFIETDRKKYVAYTYVDDNGAASVGSRPLGAGDFETKKSPTAYLRLKRRAKLKATAGAVDTATTAISHIGWYFEDGATEPALDYVADTAVVNGVATVKEFESFTGGGAAPPGTNTFPASAAGDYAAFVTSEGFPVVRANGYSRWKWRTTTALTIPHNSDRFVKGNTEDVDTDSFYVPSADAQALTATSAYDNILQFPGQYTIIVRATWTADAGGTKRDIWIEVDGVKERVVIASGTVAEVFQTAAVFVVDTAVADLILRVGVYQNTGASLDLGVLRLYGRYDGNA